MAELTMGAVQFAERSTTLKRFIATDSFFRYLTRAAAITVLAILFGVFVSLVLGAWPAFRTFGLEFLTAQTWNPVTERFGALPPMYGTIVTSLIAMVIAVPTGIGIAIFLTELCPRLLRQPIGIAIELLAGIPSIIYGIWGLFVFAPFLQQYVKPAIIGLFGSILLLYEFF